MPEIAGATPRVACARYKEWDRCDLSYVTFDAGTTVAGVTTQNLCCSAEVDLCRAHLQHGRARALVVNAGNSNAFTGQRGKDAVDAIRDQVAAHLNCDVTEIFVSSTGVIGVPLPIDKAQAGLQAVFNAAPCSWEDVTHGIGTTDTFAKGATASAMVDGHKVQIVGIIKGSGMIAPDMATMLGYIFTDAAVDAAFLQQLLSAANQSSFSCITVDSDTSTSDTVLAFATGKAGNAPLSSFDDVGADAFAAALSDVCRQLAHLVVRDGEGAQKFIEIQVSGATNDDSALRIGLAIANSPLVKTAIAGEEVNGVCRVVPQQMVSPTARLPQCVHVGAAKEIRLHIHLLDIELTRCNFFVDPLVAWVESTCVPAHRDEPGLFLPLHHTRALCVDIT